MEYFIDKRIFVSGRKSILSLDNAFNLTAFTNSQISLMGVSCAQNGLNIQTALDPITGTQTNCTELGGTLINNTTIDGDALTYNMTFDALSNFIISNSTTITLESSGLATLKSTTGHVNVESSTGVLFIGGKAGLYVKPPTMFTPVTAQPGQILTLINNGTGEADWADPSGLLNVGLGLTESPAGTVKLGGAGIGSSENLGVANTALWEITENGTIADTNLSLGIGTDPIYGHGIISDISVIGNYATTGVVAPAIGFSLEIVADNQGTIGNSISIVLDGVDNIDYWVNQWNLANPTNTATLTYILGSSYYGSNLETFNLSGGSAIDNTGLIGAIASPGSVAIPILYQGIPSLNFERSIIFDTSIQMYDNVDTERSNIIINGTNGITLESKDTTGNAMYIRLRESNGVQFGNSVAPAYSYTFPITDGLIGQSLVNDGGNNINWEDSITVVHTAINYIPNNKEVVLVTTGATDKDITLPLAARANQQITIKKIDPGAGVVHILGNGVETIDGINDQPLNSQYNAMTVVSNGTEWFIISNF